MMSGGSIPPTGQRTNAKNCTECQRRKQKCSKEWPCNHCQSRKVPHLCHFASMSSAVPTRKASASSSSTLSGSRSLSDATDPRNAVSGPRDSGLLPFKRNRDDQETTDLPAPSDSLTNIDTLKAWGYMPGNVHMQNIGRTKSDESPPGSSDVQSIQQTETDSAAAIFPDRGVTDIIVHHFLRIVNLRYCSVYPFVFTEEYTNWWEIKIRGASSGSNVANREDTLSPEFTLLLLRVCAYSTHNLPLGDKGRIEFVTGTQIERLTKRFHIAAEDLSRTFVRGQGGIKQVQQLFLKCCWFKADAELVDAWHSLSAAIREAQEMGFHKDIIEGLSAYEVEMRRRLWCILYVWDRQMAAWLSRPTIIVEEPDVLTYPSMKLRDADPQIGVSQFTPVVLQARLCQLMMRHSNPGDSSPFESIQNLNAHIDKFISELPPVLRLVNPDKSHDHRSHWLEVQRPNLHTIIRMVQLTPLKAYVTKGSDQSTRNSDNDAKLTAMGVNFALSLLVCSTELYELEFPTSAYFCTSIFSIFDTTLVLGSAIMHDTNYTLHRRPEVLLGIRTALEQLRLYGTITKIGAQSYNFAFKLIQACPLRQDEQEIFEGMAFKRVRTSESHSVSSNPQLSGRTPTDTVPDFSGPLPPSLVSQQSMTFPSPVEQPYGATMYPYNDEAYTHGPVYAHGAAYSHTYIYPAEQYATAGPMMPPTSSAVNWSLEPSMFNTDYTNPAETAPAFFDTFVDWDNYGLRNIRYGNDPPQFWGPEPANQPPHGQTNQASSFVNDNGP